MRIGFTLSSFFALRTRVGAVRIVSTQLDTSTPTVAVSLIPTGICSIDYSKFHPNILVASLSEHGLGR